MLLLARSGRRSEALAQYELCRQALEEALGIAPDAETERLADDIRSGRLEGETTQAAVAHLFPTEHLGNVQLKGLTRKIAVYRVAREEISRSDLES